jgi:hypothetical protein
MCGRGRIRTPGGVRHEGSRSREGEAAFARLEACATRGRGALAPGDRVMRRAAAACGCPRDSVLDARIDDHAKECTNIHSLMLIAVASGGRMRRVKSWWR